MPTIAKATGGSYQNPPVWSHAAYCISVIDLGTQPWSVQYPTPKRVVKLQFELPFEKGTFDWVEKPLSVWATYTLSTGEKARFRPVFEALFQWTPSEDDYYAIDFKKLVWAPCTVTLTQSWEYVNVSAVTPLTKWMVLPERVNELKVFDLDAFDDAMFNKLGEKIKEKIIASPEYKEAAKEAKF